MTTKHLDMGCGPNPRNPYNCDALYGVDVIEQNNTSFKYTQCDVIFNRLPFEDSMFDSISACNFLEHIPRTTAINNQVIFPFISIMNEVYRVLKPGEVFNAVTPGYPRMEAFINPTHVNFITRKPVFTSPIPNTRGRRMDLMVNLSLLGK